MNTKDKGYQAARPYIRRGGSWDDAPKEALEWAKHILRVRALRNRKT